MSRHLRLKLFVTLSLVGATAALAQEAPSAITAPAMKSIGVTQQAPKAKMEPSLIVLNAAGATLKDGKLTLTGVAPNSIMFADRPVRAAGHVLTSHVLEEWAAEDSFAKDPPNATVSVFAKSGDGVRDAVVVLKSPKADGANIIFDVEVLEGDLKGGDGSAAVFIDIIGMPFTPMSYAGVARRSAYRGAWYGAAAGAAMAGAAIGAAAASPYYHPYAYAPPPPYPYYPPYGAPYYRPY